VGEAAGVPHSQEAVGAPQSINQGLGGAEGVPHSEEAVGAPQSINQGVGEAGAVLHSSSHWHDTPIYRREGLPAGTALTGPAIVEQLDATTVIEPGDHARVDAFGNLEITVRGT
jgi:N-methylhydantoinase A/oxoprolinase/acetone carboxylase beta subunit